MSTDIHTNHDVADIYLFAVNSGELYPLHVKMAGRADLAVWLEHVRTTVKRLYRTQVDRNAPPFSGPAVAEAAEVLRLYYLEQIGRRHAPADR